MTPEEIDRLHDEMMEIHSAQPTRSFELAELILEQSASIGYERHLSYAHSIHARGHAWEGRNEEAVKELNLAISLAQEAGDRAAEIHATKGRGIVAKDMGHYAEAKDYLSKAVEIARESGSLASEASILNNLFVVILELGDYSEALRVAEQGLELAEETGDKFTIAFALFNIGGIYKRFADYPRALDYHARALALSEEIGVKSNIAKTLGNIGGIYDNLTDYPRALDYYGRALAINDEIGDKHSVAINLGNTGLTYSKSGDDTRALEYLKRALDLSLQLGDPRPAGYWMAGIARVERNLGNLDAAYQGFLDTLHHRRDVLKTNEGVADILIQLGCALIEQGRAEKGLVRLEEALKLAEELGEKMKASEAHEEIAEAYSKIGDGAKAFEHLKKYLTLNKEIFSEESKKKVEQFNMRVAIAEKEKERAIEKMKREQAERELANTTLQLVAHTNRLAEFRDSIREIAAKMPPSEATVRELRSKIKDLTAKAVDWKKYDEQFKAAYPEFSTKLTERYPALSHTEVRVCALLRMNLKSEDIARLFSLSERTIENHRNHIRQKMKLRREEELAIVLAKI